MTRTSRSSPLTLALAAMLAACSQPDSYTVTSRPQGDQLATPTGLVATPGTASVKLEWNPVAGATSYEVYRAVTSATNPYALIASTGLTTYKDVVGFGNVLQAGTPYHYRIMAKTNTGYDGTPTFIDSELTAPVAANLTDVPAQNTQLAAPTVTVTDADGIFRFITWTEVPNATMYDVFRVNTHATFVDQSSPLTAFSLMESNVFGQVYVEMIASPSTRFAYVVIARKDDAYYLPSPKSTLVFNQAIPKLNTPSIQASVGTYADKILVEWDLVPSATTYRVYRAESRTTTNPDFDSSSVVSPYQLVDNLTFSTYQGNSTRAFVEDTTDDILATTLQGSLTVPRYYWYKVQAGGGAGWEDSNLSVAAYGTVQPDEQDPYSVIDVPTGVYTVNNGVNAYVTVRWRAVLGSATKLAATSYDVYRSREASSTGFTRIASAVAGTVVPGAANELEYRDESAQLERGANYYYRIVARAAGGIESDLSVSTGAGYIAGLEPFTSFAATKDSSNNLLFTWSKIRNINVGYGGANAYVIRTMPGTTAPANPLTDGTAAVIVSAASADFTSIYYTNFAGYGVGTHQFWIVAFGNNGQQVASSAVAVVR